MGDRRSSFPFRFWTSAASRRTTTIQTAPPPAKASTPPPPPTETKAGSQSTPNPATASTNLPPSKTENQKPEPSSTTTQPTTNNATSADPVDEPQTSSPSRAITKPRASLQPASPSRRTTQSRSPPQPAPPSLATPASPSRRTTQSKSPPQPSSPSRAAPQIRSKPSSPSRMGSQVPSSPQRTSQPRSPPHPVSRSPKQASSPSTVGTQPTLPSKRSTQEISKSNGDPIFVPNEEAPKLAASQQEHIEPHPNEEVKSDRVKDSNGLQVNETSINHEEMEVKPSKSSEQSTTPTPAPAPIQELDSSTVNDENELLSKSNAKPEETTEVKEVVEVVNTEANEKTKEVHGFLPPKSDSQNGFLISESDSDNTKTASISDQMQVEKQEIFGKKENLAASSNIKPTNTTTQPRKRNMTLDDDKKSALANGERVPLYKEIREDISTLVNRMAIGDPKSAIYDKPVSVITLAGENRGASMHLGMDSSKKEDSIYIHRGYKINPNDSVDTTTDGEETSKEAAKTENTKTLEDQPTEAYVNNNAQSINNSLVFNCSITERNPGVHMVFTLPKEPTESTDKSSPIETRKAEFNTTTPDKLTYKPTARRRCLKGLFLEPSDSETENPEKPRRHGCRVGCKERDKHNEIDVLST